MAVRKNGLLAGLFLIGVTCVVLGGLFFLASTHSTELSSRKYLGQKKVDLIVINKSRHQLTLFSEGRLVREYEVSLGRNPGRKSQRGDGKTPEGKYKVVSKVRNSKFHSALLLSYPNEDDLQRARELGVDPGSDIEIHGLENGLGWIGAAHKYVDWTDGCIGMTDEEIDDVVSLVEVDTTVMIYP
jgi:murein L,D-transpeptidase YafK